MQGPSQAADWHPRLRVSNTVRCIRDANWCFLMVIRSLEQKTREQCPLRKGYQLLNQSLASRRSPQVSWPVRPLELLS